MEKGFYFCNTYDFKKVDFEPSKTQDTVSKNMITVLCIKPNHYPKTVAIDNSLEAMQQLVCGNIEEYMPFEDEVAIICNEESISVLTALTLIAGQIRKADVTRFMQRHWTT